VGRGGEGEQRRTDLVAALATLDGDDLTHGWSWGRWCNVFGRRNGIRCWSF